jgi:hypothetical protein
MSHQLAGNIIHGDGCLMPLPFFDRYTPQGHYEGQAAIELEARANRDETDEYAFDLNFDTIEIRPVMESILADLLSGGSCSGHRGRFS